MLLRTPSGVTSPTTVTFFVAMSMSKEVTPGLDAGLYVLVIQTELEVKGYRMSEKFTFHLGDVLLHLASAPLAVQRYPQNHHLYVVC